MKFSTAYRPQANGIVERANRDIKGMMTKLIEQHGGAWPEHLQAVIESLNMLTTRATGHEPTWLAGGMAVLGNSLGAAFDATAAEIE